MGNISSQTEDEWNLDNILSLHAYYKDQCYDFALDRPTFEKFLTKLRPGLGDRMWKKLDPHNGGVVSAMECLATLCVLAGGKGGRLSDKVDFLFCLFDLREIGRLTYDEIFILTSSVLSGTVKLTGKGHVPEDYIVEKMIDQAFRDAEKDMGATFTLEEYRAWVTKYMDLENEALEVSDVLVAFDVLEEPNMLPDCFVDLHKGDVTNRTRLHHEIHRGVVADPDNKGGNALMETLNECGALASISAEEQDKGGVPGNKENASAIANTSVATGSLARGAAAVGLILEHTYGYAPGRNNLSYVKTGEVIYPLGKLVVIVSPTPGARQRWYRLHESEVSCLSVHPQGSIIASAEIGTSPHIHIWDVTKLEELPMMIIKGLHRRGISHLAFSPSGKYLASIGDGPNGLLIIHDCSQQSIGAPAIVSKLAVCDHHVSAVCWRDDYTLITAGTQLTCWTRVTGPGQSLIKVEGKWGKRATKQLLLSVADFDGKVRTGTVGGQLYGWNMTAEDGLLCEGGPTVHDGSIFSLWSDDTSLLSGGADGLVRVLDKTLTTTIEHRIPAVNGKEDEPASLHQEVKAISTVKGQAVILAGTNSGQIYQITPNGRHQCISAGHSFGCARSLDSHPSKPYFITGGDDGIVRLWNLETREAVAVRQFDSYIRGLAFSPDGKHVCLGFGGRVEGVQSKSSGSFYILNAMTLETEASMSDFKDPILALSYSPDGSLLAFSTDIGKIYVYNAAGDFVSQRFMATTEVAVPIPKVDFSVDGAYLRLQDQARNTVSIVETTSGGSIQPEQLNLNDIRWGTRPAFWDIQCTTDGDLLVRPLQPGSSSSLHQKDVVSSGYRAHAAKGMITTVVSFDQRYLVTLGERDLGVMVWRINLSDKLEVDYAAVTDEADIDEEVAWTKAKAEEASIPGAQARLVLAKGNMDMLLRTGSNVMSHDPTTRPWLAASHEPARLPEINGEAPANALGLEWIHGMSPPTNVKGVLNHNAKGHLIYLAGRVGVVYDRFSASQKYLLDEFRSDPSCLTLNSSRNLAATGQTNSGVIVIWDTETASLVSRIDTGLKTGIAHLAFWGDHTLAAVSAGPWYQLAIYDIGLGLREAIGEATASPPRAASDLVWLNAKTLITCGARFLTVWTKTGENVLEQRRGVFGRKGVIQSILCAAALTDTKVVTGQKDGSLYLWEDGKVVASLNHLHDGPINTITAYSGLIYTGGQDGRIHVVTPVLEQGITLDVEVPIHILAASLSSTSLLVATGVGEAYEVSTDESENNKPKSVIRSHRYDKQTWALACHPKTQEFLTGGDDGQLCVWDAKSHQLIRSRKLTCPIRTLDYNSTGELLVIGTGSPEVEDEKDGGGFILVLKTPDLAEVFKVHIAQTWVRSVKFCHDDTFLAVAVEDSSVYLLDAQDNYLERGLCKGPTGSDVESMDFTDDSKHLQITTTSKNIWYFNTASCKRLKPNTPQLRDEMWTTWTAPLGWPVKEVWSCVPQDIKVTSVDRSHDGSLLACVDDCGRLRTYRYPAVADNALHNCYMGHSSLITVCRWLNGDSHLISISGNDGCIYQWALDQVEVKDHSMASLRQEDQTLLLEVQPLSRTKTQALMLNDVFVPSSKLTPVVLDLVEDNIPFIPVGLPEQDDLVLEQVYGIRIHDNRASLGSLGSGEMVFLVASLVVIQHPSPRALQRFYTKHTDEVISLAVHPDGFTMVTGQGGSCIDIHIWNSRSLQPLQVLSGLHRVGISHLAFFADGKRLLTAGQDKMHTVAVYYWEAAHDCLCHLPSGNSSSSHVDPVLSRWLDQRSALSEASVIVDNLDTTVHKHAGLVAAAPTTMNRLYDVAVSPKGDRICAVGPGFIRFWDDRLSFYGQTSHCAGPLGGEMLQQTLLCVAYLNSEVVIAGSSIGELHVFKDAHLTQTLRAHKGAINVLTVLVEQGLFISGGKDGTIGVWSFDIQSRGNFSLSSWRALRLSEALAAKNSVIFPKTLPPVVDPNAVRSLCFHEDGNKVLVATGGAEVLVWTRASDDVEIAFESHNVNQTWGLATHPKSLEFATGGDDRFIRLWDGSSHELIRKRQLESSIRALAYSPDGSLLVAGFGGGGKGEEEIGAFIVLNSSTLDTIYKETVSPCKAAVRDIKFSPDGSLLAVASNDLVIHVYESKNDYNKRGMCTGHRLPVVSLDFSENGQFLQSCGGSATTTTAKTDTDPAATVPEILYWSTGSCKQIRPKFSPEVREIKWSSWTLPNGWPVQGHITKKGTTDVVLSSSDRSKDGKLVAVMDLYGRVRMSGYPCVDAEETLSYTYRGHGGLSGGRCRWTSKDSHLITVGGYDRAIMQWRHARSRFAPSTASVVERTDPDADVDIQYPERSFLQQAINEGTEWPSIDQISPSFSNATAQPWRSVMTAPTIFSKDMPTVPADTTVPPSGDLKLSWIHGYDGHRLRNQVKYTTSGKVVYAVGSIGIVYDPLAHTQQHFCSHTDNIISLAISNDGRYVATGQLGQISRICIWDTVTLAEVSMLRGRFEKGIVALAFSHSGSMLACVGNDEDHTLGVYNWRSEACLYVGKVGRSNVLCMEFSLNDSLIVVGTATDVTFHTVGTTRYLRRRKGVWGKRYRYQPTLCCKHLENGLCVTGMFDGSVYFWDDNVCKGMIMTHKGSPVHSIDTKGTNLITAGGDGKLKMWTAGFLESKELAHYASNPIKSLHTSLGGALVFATDDGKIMELNDTSTQQTPKTLVSSHCLGSIMALATHPHNKLEYVTGGADKSLRFWDLGRRCSVRTKALDAPISSAVYSSDGSLLAVGCGDAVNVVDDDKAKNGDYDAEHDGTIIILNAYSLDVVFKEKRAEGCISCLKFSPDGALLACGSHDHKIYLYEVITAGLKKSFNLRFAYKSHTSYVTQLDFTADGRFLQSSSGAHELLYWNAVTGKQMINGGNELKDVKWQTWTLPYGYPVQGLWLEEGHHDGVEITAVDRSKSGKMVAAVDNHGQLRVYNYPVDKQVVPGWLYGGHAPLITNCRWSLDDGYLITTGGEDKAIFQWKWTSDDKDMVEEAETKPTVSKTSPGRSQQQKKSNKTIAD